MPDNRILPHSLEAERTILGAILLDDKSYWTVAEILGEYDFYLEGHRVIWRSIAELAADKSPIDLLTLRAKLIDREEQEKAGGVAYIAGLPSDSAACANVKHYSLLVKQKAALRDLVRLGNEIQEAAYQPDATVTAILERLQGEIVRLSQASGRNRLRPMSEIAHDGFRELQARRDRKRSLDGLSTGLALLDEFTGGLKRGNLIVVAGRPGTGKSALCLNIAADAALRQGARVAVFSLEMSEQEVYDRLVCSESQLNPYWIGLGHIQEGEWTRIGRVSAGLSDSKMWVCDAGSISILQIQSRVQALALSSGVDLVIVDYLQLISGSVRRGRNDTRAQEVGEVSRTLKLIAKDHKIPVLAACQFNRNADSGEPSIAMLKESGDIEQDMDIGILLWESKDKELQNVKIGKNRNGPTGKFVLTFERNHARFKPYYPSDGI